MNTADIPSHQSASANPVAKPVKRVRSSHINIDPEGLTIFNRLGIVIILVLFSTAIIQTLMFNRFLTRIDEKMVESNQIMQQTNQLLEQDLKRMGGFTLHLPPTGTANVGSEYGTNTSFQEIPLSKQGRILVQKELGQRGFQPGNLQGDWDDATLTALQKFQQANNLPPGRLDDRTLRRLGLEPDQISRAQLQ